MKIKIVGLLMAFIVTSALAMEEELTAETIINHPNFLEAKQAIEEMGGSITIFRDRISLNQKLASGSRGQSVYFCSKSVWQGVKTFYEECLAWKTHPWELKKTLPKTLRGLCILDIAERYHAGEQRVIERFCELPEDVPLIISKLKGHV